MRNKTMVWNPRLAALWEKEPGPGRWLVHLTSARVPVSDVTASVIGGPYWTQKQLMAGLNSFLRSGNYDDDDTIHIRTFAPKVAEALGVQAPVHGVRQSGPGRKRCRSK